MMGLGGPSGERVRSSLAEGTPGRGTHRRTKMNQLLILLLLQPVLLRDAWCQSTPPPLTTTGGGLTAVINATPPPLTTTVNDSTAVTNATLPPLTTTGSGSTAVTNAHIDFYDLIGSVYSADWAPSDRSTRTTFVIHTTAPHVIKIKFQWLSLQNDTACASERLDVIDGDANSGETLVVLCGLGRDAVPPRRLKSTGQNLTLVLTSSGPLQDRGFSLTYDSMAPTRTSLDCGLETGGWTNPWATRLYNSSGALCEATLVGAWWLLTTASCFASGETRDLATWSATLASSNGTRLNVTAAIPHPKYNASTSDYDVAMVRLGEPVAASDATRPACLPHLPQPSPLPGKACYVPTARGADVRVSAMDQSDCKAAYNTSAVTSRMLCASSDSCQALSKTAGLLCKEVDGRKYVTGLASWGNCVQSTYVFTRIWRILPFINSTIEAYY